MKTLFTARGIVEKGKGEGTQLGFPTLNIPLSDKTISGIYAAQVAVEGHICRAAVYADQKRGALEAHLLDFSGDLYGKTVVVELYEKIRNDMRFKNETELIRAIEDDVKNVREFFTKSY